MTTDKTIAATIAGLVLGGYMVALFMRDGASFVEGVGGTVLSVLLLAAIAGMIAGVSAILDRFIRR